MDEATRLAKRFDERQTGGNAVSLILGQRLTLHLLLSLNRGSSIAADEADVGQRQYQLRPSQGRGEGA